MFRLRSVTHAAQFSYFMTREGTFQHRDIYGVVATGRLLRIHRLDRANQYDMARGNGATARAIRQPCAPRINHSSVEISPKLSQT
jgi:hypothetical protein